MTHRLSLRASLRSELHGPQARSRFSRLKLWAFLLLAPLLAACDSALIGDSRLSAAHVPLVAARAPNGLEVITPEEEISGLRRFFTPENLRETVFSGSTRPRIAGGAQVETSGEINAGRVNNGPDGARQSRAAFYTEIEGEELFIQPLDRATISGGQWQAPLTQREGSIALNFDNEPLPQALRSVLGGILGLNYVVGDTVSGNVTFRSERRFSHTELLQVMADIVARNGYLIQYFNGVYHVGTPAEIESLTGMRARSALASDATHVIALRRPLPSNTVEVVNALVPPGNVVTIAEGSNSLIVQGDPSQFSSIEQMVRSLVEAQPNVQALAILPVRRSPPEEVAEQVSQIFGERGLGSVTVVPVPSVPGILVAANTRHTITQIGDIVSALDVEDRDRAQIRMIQLSHSDAGEMAQRLNEIVGQGALLPEPGGDPAAANNLRAAAADQASAGTSARGVTQSGLRAPRFLSGGDDDEPQAARSARGPRGSGEAISFSSDPRNNALLVRSNFAEFQRVQELVRTLDTPRAQVVIEATIIEVDINDDLQYGVQVFLQGNGFNLRSSTGPGGAADPGGGGFTALLDGRLGGNPVQAVVSALQQVTNVQVISSPYLTVVDGATSRLNVGDQVPFVIASQTSQNNGTVTVTQEVDTRDIGVIMDVTPRISPNNAVLLDITQEVSSARTVETAAGSNPVISQRRVQSQIVVQSGATALLGGLIQETSETRENGVPVVRRIPVVGDLFNRTANANRRTELLVLITPRVVRNANGLDGITQQLRRQSASR